VLGLKEIARDLVREMTVIRIGSDESISRDEGIGVDGSKAPEKEACKPG